MYKSTVAWEIWVFFRHCRIGGNLDPGLLQQIYALKRNVLYHRLPGALDSDAFTDRGRAMTEQAYNLKIANMVNNDVVQFLPPSIV